MTWAEQSLCLCARNGDAWLSGAQALCYYFARMNSVARSYRYFYFYWPQAVAVDGLHSI